MSASADEELDFPDHSARLHRGCKMRVGAREVPCDRMVVVDKHTGQEDDVAIHRNGNRRAVKRVRESFKFEPADESNPVQRETFGLRAEPVSPEEEGRFLMVYDHFANRAFPA
ncbi:MAG: hypothetical protein ACLGP3_09015 [Acidobacteriota bacterium]|jgi:hypothetical protein